MLPKCHYLLSSIRRRTRSYQSVATIVSPSRLAPSKLPQCRYLRVPSHLAPSKLPKYQYSLFFHATRSLEVTKVSLLPCGSPPVLRPRCSQSATIYLFSTPLRRRSYQSGPRNPSYQSLATFVFPSHLAASKLPKYNHSLFFYATRSLEVTKVSLLSCSLPVLRPRCSNSAPI